MTRFSRAGFILLLVLFQAVKLFGQTAAPSDIFHAYENDGFLNDLGRGTDHAYTSGLQVNLLYAKSHPSRFFVDHLLPKAGDSSVNTYGIGLMQILYTPNDLSAAYYIPNDYTYATANIAKYSLYSFNAQKKYDFQTEVVAGIMGPAALGKQAQRWLHNAIRDTGMPNGWANQYLDDVLFNINFSAEKLLFSNNKSIEIIGDAGLCAGTMLDEAEIGPTIRIGKMQPYFQGYMNHFYTSYSEKGWNYVQLYLIIRPAIQYVLYNAMLQGGLFSASPTVSTFITVDNMRDQIYFEKPKQAIENFVGYIAYGPVLAYRHFSMSFTQSYYTQVLKGVYPCIYGNISIYYSW